MTNAAPHRVRCAVVGATGYTGLELVTLLLGHPFADLRAVFGSEKRAGEPPMPLSSIFPSLRARCDLPLLPAGTDAILQLKPDAVFLCTPHEASHDLAPALAQRGVTVIDLSAAFRLKDASLYPKHYSFEHAHPGWLDRAVYGLPELFRDQLRAATLIAVPGCYPTSAILPLAPLARAGAIEQGRRPIVDSVSGVSGAGRHATLANLFCEVSMRPYNVFKHRHNPEIDAYAGTPVVFTPHLGPYDRGILSTIHVDLADGWTERRAREALADAYAREPFIRLLPPGEWPSVAAVRGTNYCDIALAADDDRRHLIICSAIDNLVKGAAGQGVQCFNARFSLPETLSLIPAYGMSPPQAGESRGGA